MSDSQVVGGSVSPADETSGVGLPPPEPGGPLVLQGVKQFDTGTGLPASALSGGGQIVSVHESKEESSGIGKLYYNFGTLSASSGIHWLTSHGVEFASGYSNPSVAINDQANSGDLGIAIAVYQNAAGSLFWAGAAYNAEGISWFCTDIAIPNVTTIAPPVVALTDNGTVVVIYAQPSGWFASLVGTVNWPEAKSITWGTPQEPGYLSQGASSAVAVNQKAQVVMCVRPFPGAGVNASVGTLMGNQSIAWSTPRHASDFCAGAINAALDDSGNVIVTMNSSGTNQPAYNVGQIVVVSGISHVSFEAPQPSEKWAFPASLTTQDLGLSVAVNSTSLLLIWQNKGKDYYCAYSTQWLPSAERAAISAPAPGGPISLQPAKEFDTGTGLPASALSAGNQVVSVHESKGTTSGELYYDLGTLSGGEVNWLTRGQSFAKGYSTPVVAINDLPDNGQSGGVVVTVYQKDGTLYYSAGSYNSTAKEITWFVSETQIPVATTTTAPTVALDNKGYVLVTYTQGGELWSMVGFLDWPNSKSIGWGDPLSVCLALDSGGLAMDERKNAVLCYRDSATENLYSLVGEMKPNLMMSWSTSPTLVMGTTSDPVSVSLDEAFNVIVTTNDADTALPVYNVGRLNPNGGQRNGTVSWNAAPGQPWQFTDLNEQDIGLSVGVNRKALILIYQNDKKYYVAVGEQWPPSGEAAAAD